MAKGTGDRSAILAGSTTYYCMTTIDVSTTSSRSSTVCSGASGKVEETFETSLVTTYSFSIALDANDTATEIALAGGTNFTTFTAYPESVASGDISYPSTNCNILTAQATSGPGQNRVLNITAQSDSVVTPAAIA